MTEQTDTTQTSVVGGATDTKTADTKVADTTATDTTHTTDTKTADTKTADTKTSDTKTADTKADTKTEVEYKFNVPEGMTLDEKALDSYKTLAKEFGLDPDKASKLFDLHTAQIQQLAKTNVDANAKLWQDTQAAWKKELDADPVFGGSNAVEAQAIIGRALDEFGSKEARAAFDLTGAGNNPHIVKFVYAMANALAEGGPTPQGRPPGSKGKSLGQILYDKAN